MCAVYEELGSPSFETTLSDIQPISNVCLLFNSNPATELQAWLSNKLIRKEEGGRERETSCIPQGFEPITIRLGLKDKGKDRINNTK